MYRIQSDCYEAESTRANPATAGIEAHDVSVKLYPNPVQDEVRIDAAHSIETLEILQLDGTLVYSFHPNEQSAHISLAGLNPGMYLVNVKTTAGSESYRFVKN
jgi:hypothetical protein